MPHEPGAPDLGDGGHGEERDRSQDVHAPIVPWQAGIVTDEPETAEALMRSRFEAFKRGDRDWLLQTWHPTTRPDDLDLSDNPRWRGLQILDTEAGGAADDTGVVEFRATYVADGELGILQERSRFVREDGRWLYVDGDVR
nr:YchJ family metal-binding protein [Aeromicrobium duanguangcaii]